MVRIIERLEMKLGVDLFDGRGSYYARTHSNGIPSGQGLNPNHPKTLSQAQGPNDNSVV